MWTDRLWLGTAVRLSAYAVCAALIALATGWSTYRVGLTVVSLLDTKIMDGSGRAGPQPVWTAPPLATGPETVGPLDGNGASTVLTAGALKPSLTVPPRASTDDPIDDPAADFHNGAADTYRTYCVRLCDGYYWPISFSTTSDRFDADESACKSACGSPAKLFVHRVPGGGPGTMVSIDGLPYSALKSAFLFRSRYDAQCKCQAQPWEEAAKDRHRLFAAAAAARRGDRAAAVDAKRLAAKVEADRQQSLTALEAANAEAERELRVVTAKADLGPPHRPARRRTETSALRLGALPVEASPRRGFVAASGSSRGWKERAFGDN